MSAEELGHREGADAFVAEDLGHLLVGSEILLVLGVLEIVFLKVSPELLDAFGTASLLLADDISELRAELHRSGKSGSFFLCHFVETSRVSANF